MVNPDTASVILVDCERRGVYLSQRLAAAKCFIGYWQSPGGHRHPEEGIIQAAARELMEESGVIRRPWDLEKLNLVEYHEPVHHYCQIYATALYRGEAEHLLHERDKSTPWQFFDWVSAACLQPLMPGLEDALVYLITREG